MLKHISVITGQVLLVACLGCGSLYAEELDTLVKTSKEIIDTYALNMQINYENAYQKNDLLFVKEVCEKQAKENAIQLARNGWTIQRISLDYVNIDNVPDQTERRILKDFTAKQSAGENPDDLAWYKLSEIGNQSEFRYIKAFTLEERCMSCHARKNKKSGAFPKLAAYSVRKTEMKNYLPDKSLQNPQIPLPEFEE